MVERRTGRQIRRFKSNRQCHQEPDINACIAGKCISVIGGIDVARVTVQSASAEKPPRPPVRSVGCPRRRTKTTSKEAIMRSGSDAGGRPILATGAKSSHRNKMRYKRSLMSKALWLRRMRWKSLAVRYKISSLRNPL